MPQMSQILRQHASGMLTAGMSTNSCCPWIKCSFLYHKPSPNAFQRICQYIQPTSRSQTTCNHTTPGPPHPASSPPRSSKNQPPRQLLQQSVCISKEFLHKLSETVSGKLICMFVVHIRCRNRIERENAHIRWRLALWRGVSSRMNHGFHCTGQMAHSEYGVVWVSGLLMPMLWIEWPMVTVGSWYGQVYTMENEHRCILLKAFWMHRDTVTRSWGPMLCHSSTTITSMLHG